MAHIQIKANQSLNNFQQQPQRKYTPQYGGSSIEKSNNSPISTPLLFPPDKHGGQNQPRWLKGVLAGAAPLTRKM